MRKIIFIFTILNISLAVSTPKKIQAVYGEDNRVDIFQISNQQIIQATKSTAAMIQKKFIEQNEKQEFTILAGAYGKAQNLCSDEKFYDQPAVANCTTFLIENDLLMTAGHCVKLMPCQNFSFVFDFQMKNQSESQMTFSKDQVYNCKNVERLSLEDNVDYALIRLDRPVTGRTPLRLRKYGELDQADVLFLLGFPSGLPMKADLDQRMRQMSENKIYFSVEFDAFGANSGSPVINQKTLEVEGVLVRGEYDFEWDNNSNCRRVKKCPPGTCKGEEATIVSESMIYPQNAVAMTNGCSAFLVNSSPPTIVTNGHCVGRIPFGFEWRDKKKEKVFDFYSPSLKNRVSLFSDKILYATMTNTDIAVLNVNHTWQELASYGLNGLRIYPASLKENKEILRLERYPTFSNYSCLVEKIIPKVTESSWTWLNAFRHGCENWGGASGSPIIDKNSGLLVGIHNTANEAGQICTENNPCEVGTDGQIEVHQGKGYGQQIDVLSKVIK